MTICFGINHSLCLYQKWVRFNLRTQVASKAVDLDHLLEGKAAAFVHVHSSAMLLLVTDSNTIKADIVPETLLFDVHRLGMLQREFENIVTSVTMIVTATHNITATKNPADLQVLAKISDILTPEQGDLDLEKIIADIGIQLRNSSLPVYKQQNLSRALLQCASPTDAVHQLL